MGLDGIYLGKWWFNGILWDLASDQLSHFAVDKGPVYSWFTYSQWWFSVVMLNCQRVVRVSVTLGNSWVILVQSGFTSMFGAYGRIFEFSTFQISARSAMNGANLTCSNHETIYSHQQRSGKHQPMFTGNFHGHVRFGNLMKKMCLDSCNLT